MHLPRGRQIGPVTYGLQFSEDARGLVILHESVGQGKPDIESNGIYLNRAPGRAQFGPAALKLMPADGPEMFLPSTESVLAQFKSLADPTPITEVGIQLTRIRIYREFRTGAQSPARFGIGATPRRRMLSRKAATILLSFCTNWIFAACMNESPNTCGVFASVLWK